MFFLCVCVCLVSCKFGKLYFKFGKMKMKKETVFSDSVYYLHPLWEISYYFKDQIIDFNKTIHRFTSLYLAVSWYLKKLICLNKSKTLAVCPSDSTQTICSVMNPVESLTRIIILWSPDSTLLSIVSDVLSYCYIFFRGWSRLSQAAFPKLSGK